MSKTRLELVTQALIDLGVIATGQSVSDQDMSKMDGFVDPVVDELSGLDIYYVQDAGAVGPTGGEIEDAAFLSLSKYLANAASAAFNLAADAKMTVLADQARAKLETLAAPSRMLRRARIDPILLTGRRVGLYRGGL